MKLELTEEETEFLRSVLTGVPLQGSFVQVEKAVEVIRSLLEKLNSQVAAND